MAAVISILLGLPCCNPRRSRPGRFSERRVRVRRVAQCCDPLSLPPCCQKDPAVGETNGAGGQKEGEHRGHQSKGQGDPQAALEGKAT